jgi:hypothetical protein
LQHWGFLNGISLRGKEIPASEEEKFYFFKLYTHLTKGNWDESRGGRKPKPYLMVQILQGKVSHSCTKSNSKDSDKTGCTGGFISVISFFG